MSRETEYAHNSYAAYRNISTRFGFQFNLSLDGLVVTRVFKF